MQPRNTLIIMSDEHNRRIAGCYGDSIVQTPHLDGLAARGTRFTQAYTASPICVSARASFATGQWVHQHRCWSSAEAYAGRPESWGHVLQRANRPVVSIGKLHYRSRHDDNGFDREILPLHIVGERGWTLGLLRDPLPPYPGAAELAADIGAGDSKYSHYDRNVCAAAQQWLESCGRDGDKPWTLFVSFVSPHYPLRAPQEYFDRYIDADIGEPELWDFEPQHPALKKMYAFYDYREHFGTEQRRIARAAYYGLVNFLDDRVGALLATLDELGLAGDTRVIYTSDHGEMLGEQGMWTKMLMHESSAGVPLIMAGPDIPRGAVVDAPVSLVDIHPTILESAGLASDARLPGDALFAIANGAERRSPVISEFHDGGSPCGYFMLRLAHWKYIYWCDGPAQLFDLRADPLEADDLGSDPAHTAIRAHCEAALREICDPDAANRQAFADQAARIARYGGRESILGAAGGDFGFTPLDDIEAELRAIAAGRGVV